MSKTRKISILGSTGSIGIQTLDVIEKLGDMFEINYLTINTRIDLLEPQIKKFNPKGVVISDETKYKEFKSTTSFKGEILCGEDGVISAACDDTNDLLLTALVGFAGVIPTYYALQKGIDIALANKETLVSAGSIITKLAKEKNAKILAVDSEHSAILQCLIGEDFSNIEKIILTASGGPFRNTLKSEFEKITVESALKHPNWTMGSKITIDSATMMNKGLEVIEAYWLFGLSAKQIETIVHPQSIIHSMVQFNDGSIKAQMGLPDMRVPISYALTYPKHSKFDFPRMDFEKFSNLTFEKTDLEKFECLQLAYDALEVGGTAPAIINAANEIAVQEFLNKNIGFNQIPYFISKALNTIEIIKNPSLDELINIDKITRIFTNNEIKK